VLELALHILDIVENSVRAGATRIRIAIREITAEDLFLMRITDNGKGMTPEECERALDPFFTTKQSRGGTGLGLSISYNIVRNHGGDLAIASQPGRGTTVTVSLPIAKAPERAPEGAQA